MALRRVGSGGSVVPLFHEGGGVHELPFRPFRSTFRLTWVGLPSFTQSQEGGGVHHLAFRHSAVPHSVPTLHGYCHVGSSPI